MTRSGRVLRVPTARIVVPPPPRKGLLARLGPGLVTGASDDDPSGIATYSQAGAQFGYALCWVMLFCLPFMAAIQEVCARIGRVTGQGIAGNIRAHYPPWVLLPVVGLLLAANVESIVPWLERTFRFQILDADVYYVTRIPSTIETADVVTVGLVAFVLTWLSTLYPAFRAAQTEPAEALRYE